MNKIKNNKSLLKKLSLIICFILLISFITIHSMNVNAVDTILPSEPTFDIKMNPITPNPAMVGEDITVSGVITPKSFESDIPKKEIVLVLDTSGSMSDEVSTICTNPTVRHEISGYNVYYGYDGNLYTSINRSWVKVTEINRHYYIDDYCEEHQKIGVHYATKISQLKNAALNFVDKMKNIPNLKIGIVTYSGDATINRALIDNKSTSLIPANNVEKLNEIINGLNANGGTNTGEGLRKATYLLSNNTESDITANKTVVLMTDGIPTYYTRINSYNNNYYLKTDTETSGDAWNSGDGNNDTWDLKDLGYAKTVGGLIKGKGYNVFSVGYGLGTSGNENLTQIHQSMGGSTATTDGTFFATDAGAIDSVFSKIADKIINSYTITNVKINLNLNSNFTLNIGGNAVNINNIVYTLTSQSNGKYVYTAPDINFSFTIKGTNSNFYGDIFQSSQLAVPWNGSIKNTNIPQTSITIKSSGLPDIEASMKSLESEPYQVGKTINAIYTITPKSFTFQSSNGSSVPKDVVILLDVSNDAMNGKLDAVKQAISNKLLHDNELQTCKSRYSIVTYSDSAVYNKLNENDTDVKQNCNSESNYSDLVKRKILDSISVSSSNNRNITNALVLAQSILDNGRNEPATNLIDVNRGSGSKNIIIIGGNSITDQDRTSLTTQINNIKSKNYNIITFNVGQVDSVNEEPSNNLKSLHYSLIGKQENSSENLLDKEGNNYYINVDYRQFDANNPHSLFLYSNNINSNNTIEYPVMYRIANKLKGGVKQSYTLKAKLKFNKGDKFDIVSGLTSCSDGNYNAETNEFNIVYTLKNGAYSADPFDISFQIKPNQTGTLEFGKPGFISYTNLENQLTGNVIEPFSITVQSPIQILKYGLYEGIKENSPSIYEGDGTFNILKGTNVTLGATLHGSISNSEDIKLEIIPGQLSTAPIVFTYDSTWNLNRVGILEVSPDSDNQKKTYKYKSDTGDPITDKNILIQFSENLSETLTANQYNNILYVSNDNRNVIINIIDKSKAPDLF